MWRDVNSDQDGLKTRYHFVGHFNDFAHPLSTVGDNEYLEDNSDLGFYSNLCWMKFIVKHFLNNSYRRVDRSRSYYMKDMINFLIYTCIMYIVYVCVSA